jgi:uncharacterized protein (TIGR03067 family)
LIEARSLATTRQSISSERGGCEFRDRSLPNGSSSLFSDTRSSLISNWFGYRRIDMPTTMSAPAVWARPRTDVEQLQGAWKAIAGRREARLLIAGLRFAFEFGDGDGEIYLGTFVLDSEAAPRRIDMQIEEGPDMHQGQPTYCIYHLESDILRWCATKPGSGVRLRNFPRVDDDKYLSLVFRHVRALANQR